ncbi:MAG: DEAD/DEAH box helicase [Thiomonas sp.]
MGALLPEIGVFPSPRAFQERAHEALREGIRSGHKDQVLCAATGAGKTYLGLRVAHEAIKKGRRAAFVCDRNTLIDQTSETADRYGLSDHGVVQAQHWRYNPSAPLQIISTQTISRRMWPQVDVLIVDECHTQHKGWVEHVQTFRGPVIGLSATPFARGMGKLFSRVVNAATMKELTDTGVLVPMRVMSATRPDMTGAATSGGEWTQEAAAERGMEIIGDVVGEWLMHAENRKSIVFGATIAHCEELCRQFNEAGVMAAVFTSYTTPTERKHLLDEYRKPDSAIRVLISVEALAKGFDVPDVECVVDCRPLRKSLSTAMQMWGRGLRSAPGKKDCLLLDHSGNILRFKADFEDVFFNGVQSLDDGEKLDRQIRREPEEKEDRGCPKCGYKPFTLRCMACGFEIVRQSLVEAEPGKMREIVIGTGANQVQMDGRDLWRELCTYQQQHGYRKGFAYYKYKEIAGKFPSTHWPHEPGLRTPSMALLNKIKSLQIRFAKGRAA